MIEANDKYLDFAGIEKDMISAFCPFSRLDERAGVY